MGRQRRARLILLVRILRTEPAALGSIVERVLAALHPLRSSASQSVSIHWNLAVQPLLDTDYPPAEQSLATLQERVAQGTDHLVPMGYCGALHPLLVREELEREIAWMHESPWRDDGRDLLLPPPTVIMPWGSDLHRESTAEFLREAGLVWSTGAVDAGKGQNLRFEGAAGTFLVPVVMTNAGARDVYRRVKAAAQHARPLMVLAEICDPDEDAGLESAVEALVRTAKRGTALEWPRLSDCLTEGGAAGKADQALPVDPSHRASWIEAWRLRRAEATGEDRIRSILARFAPEQRRSCAPLPQPSHEKRERILIASMLGTAELVEDHASASFTDGRLTAIAGPAGEYPLPLPVRSYVTVESGRRVSDYPFQTDSAFSFEAEGIRGLQESLSVGAPGEESPSTISLEYFHVDGFSCLLVNVSIRHVGDTADARVLTYAPIEIPLFSLARRDHVVATSLYPDGSSAGLGLDAHERTAELAGTGFFFSPAISRLPQTVDRAEPPYLMIAFPDSGESCTDILPVRVARNGRGWVLYANPRGSYRRFPRSAVAGTEERFSMMLTVTSRLRIPTVPARARAALYSSSVAPVAG